VNHPLVPDTSKNERPVPHDDPTTILPQRLPVVAAICEAQVAKPRPFFPNGYNQRLFTQAHHEALANIINDYKQATGEFQSVRGVEDTLSLYFSKDNLGFELTTWRKGLSRTDY
jgi:hypothetical protein